MVSDYTNYHITQTRFKLGFTAGGIHQYQITQIIRLCDIRLRDPDCIQEVASGLHNSVHSRVWSQKVERMVGTQIVSKLTVPV